MAREPVLDIEPVIPKVPADPVIRNGLVTFPEVHSAFMWTIKSLLEEGMVITRKGRFYRTLKPLCFQVESTNPSLLTLPGSNFHDPQPWMFSELMDWITGPLATGGWSIKYDKHRRTVYPRASGDEDWSYKSEFGRAGRAQLEWARRSLRQDSAPRNCVITAWNVDRDLIRYVSRKEKTEQYGTGKGEEYQRLPCILSAQFTVDEQVDKHGLKVMVTQRSLDAEGAWHTDVFRCAEAAHWLALTSMTNGGHGGGLTTYANTCVVESYGAEMFVRLGRLLEIWKSDPDFLTIPWQFPDTKSQYPAEVPKQKAYDWWYSQWELVELCWSNIYKAQWELFMKRLPYIKYPYWQDLLLTLATFECLIQEKRAPEIRQQFYDAKQVLEGLNWLDLNGQEPLAIQMAKRIQGYFKFWAASELFIHYGEARDRNRQEQTLALLPKNLHKSILLDSFAYLGKRDIRWMFDELPPDVREIYDHAFLQVDHNGK